MSPEDDGDESSDELTEEEFTFLDRQLDQLSSALDAIEQRNDDLHGQLKELLQSSREARKAMAEEAAANKSKDPPPPEGDAKGQSAEMEQG